MVRVIEPNSKDVPKLQHFILKAWSQSGPQALGWTGASDEAIKEISSEGFLRQVIKQSDMRVFAAEQGEEIVGFAVSRMIDEKMVELAGIIVLEELKGKGVGSALFEEAKKSAIRAGFDKMIVKTETINNRAISFYESKGFLKIGTKKEDVRGIPVDLMVLHLDLKQRAER